MRKVKQCKQKEIGRVKLNDTQDLVASMVDNEKVGLRVVVDTKNYKGHTKNGLRFYLFDGNWEEFRKLINEVGKVYEGKA